MEWMQSPPRCSRLRPGMVVVGLLLGLVGSALPSVAEAAGNVSRCRAAIGSAGGKYVGARYRVVARCRENIRAGNLPEGTDCAADGPTRAALDKAEKALRRVVARRCKRVTAADLGYPTADCPDVVEPADIVTCLIAAYGGAVDTFIPGAPTTATSTSSTTTTTAPPGFVAGDTIPGFVLKGPTGGMADIRAQASHDAAAGTWSVVLTRALTTPFADDDRQFDLGDPGNVYWFGIAVLDNAHGDLGTMGSQDPGPYTLGNESSTQPAGSKGHLKAKQETPTGPSGFTGASLAMSPNPPTPAVTLKAAYDSRNIYVLATWPDNDADIAKEHWVFDGTAWARTEESHVQGGEPGKFDEDRLTIFWDINAQDFMTEGCFAVCHMDRHRSRNLDGRADLWHWKAARTNPLGYADDQRLDPDVSKCPITPCRQNDTGTGIDSANQDASGTLPAFMAENDPGANASFLINVAEGASRAAAFVP